VKSLTLKRCPAATGDRGWKQQYEKHQGQTGGRVIYSSQNMAWRGRYHGETPPGTRELAGTISLPSPPA